MAYENKKFKEITEKVRQTLKKRFKEDEPINQNKKGIEDNKEVRKFLREKGYLGKVGESQGNETNLRLWRRILKWDIPINDLKDTTLLLMTCQGTIKVIEGLLPDTLYVFKRPDEKQKRGIWLSSNKVQTIDYKGRLTRCWVAHENEAFPYPCDVMHESSLMKRMLEKIMLNYKELETGMFNKQMAEKILLWVFLGGVAIYVIYKINPLGIVEAIRGGVGSVRP